MSGSSGSSRVRPQSWSGLPSIGGSVVRENSLLRFFREEIFEDALEVSSLQSLPNSSKDSEEQPLLWEFSFSDSGKEDILLRWQYAQNFCTSFFALYQGFN